MDNRELSDALVSNYMLASVTVRTWGATKKDDAATAELLTSKHAEVGSAAVTKRLFGRKYAKLEEACAKYNFIRNWYYANSLAWSTSSDSERRGARLVGTYQAMEFLRTFARLKTEAEAALQEFLDDYDRAVADAQIKLGAMYDPTAYPPRNVVRSKFDATMTLTPLPSGADFSRMSIPAAMAEGLRERYELRAKAQVDCALDDLQARLLAELERLSTQLGKVAKGEKTRLFKSLNTNMQTLTALARSLAPLKPELEALADHIDNELLAHEVEDYKDNAALARRVVEQAAAAVTMLKGTPDQPATPASVDVGTIGDVGDFDMDSVFDAAL
jgi:hypothetical protein